MITATLHKLVVTNTPVYPKGRKPYMRENAHQVLCGKSWAEIGYPHDLTTPYDENVTCPECLLKLGGRRDSNKDVMASVKEHEEFDRKHFR